MKLAVSSMILEIDAFCSDKLGIPVKSLMKKSGDAVADAVRKIAPKDRRVVILAGKGNNGGDGYAAAVSLMPEYDVTVYDVFSMGQKYPEGKFFREKFISLGGKIINYEATEAIAKDIKNAGCIVDAVFGTGFAGEMPEFLRPLAISVREAVGAHKIAVDVPLGINPDDGSVSDFAISVEVTVALSFVKPGIISYPARSYVGDIIYADLGIPDKEISESFSFRYHTVDDEWICEKLPKREENSHKGSFGKLLMITGSERYRGAAHLSLEAALRSGVGLVSFLGSAELVSELSLKYPEVIYEKRNISDSLTDSDIENIIESSKKYSAILLGSGSDNTEGLLRLTKAFLSGDGAPLILDADAINALAGIGPEGIALLRRAKREVILTPHPLEFARLAGMEVAAVQLHRLEAAEKFAAENKVILVLKGAGTVITDGKQVYINTRGSSSLAKAGSGDVLAGVIASLVAQGRSLPLDAAAIGVYLHAVAGQTLAGEFSAYGVTPSDLPRQIARELSEIEKMRSADDFL